MRQNMKQSHGSQPGTAFIGSSSCGRSNTTSNSNTEISSDARGSKKNAFTAPAAAATAATTTYHTSTPVKLESAQIKGRWADEDSSDDED